MSFIINKLKERIDFIEKNAGNDKKEMLTELHDTFLAMKEAGVNDDNDYRDFFYIMTYTPKIAKDIIGKALDNDSLAKVSHIIYKDREEFPINTLYNFYKAVEASIKKIEPITKKAYPQGLDSMHFQPPYDLEKWVQAFRELYVMKNRGLDDKQAFNKITEKWDAMAKKDFEHWLKFYEGGNHLSYKLAAEDESKGKPPVYYDLGGVPTPMSNFKTHIPFGPQKEEDEEKAPDPKASRQEIVSDKIRALIGRLNSAERIYTSNPEFRELLGNEHEAWLATLHQLKRKLQTVPIQNIATIEDLVIKFSNQIKAKGLLKTAETIIKVAQGAPPPPPVGSMETPPGGDLMAPEGDLEASPDMSVPDMPMDDNNDPDAAMNEFMENLGARPDKKKEKEEENETDDIVVSEEDYDLFKKAQIAPIPEAGITPSDLSVEEKSPAEKQEAESSGDDVLEEALKHITIDNVIQKLEGLTQLYKNRPLARELTIVDLMMDALGISSYFPNMAEATKSALDSNQYVLTRIEDVLAKIRGASAAESGKLDVLKQKLQRAEETDSQKREVKETSDMGEAPVPEGATPPIPGKEPKIPESPAAELAGPAEIQTPQQPGVRVK